MEWESSWCQTPQNQGDARTPGIVRTETRMPHSGSHVSFGDLRHLVERKDSTIRQPSPFSVRSSPPTSKPGSAARSCRRNAGESQIPDCLQPPLANLLLRRRYMKSDEMVNRPRYALLSWMSPHFKALVFGRETL
jgi:hypothetical protein